MLKPSCFECSQFLNEMLKLCVRLVSDESHITIPFLHNGNPLFIYIES